MHPKSEDYVGKVLFEFVRLPFGEPFLNPLLRAHVAVSFRAKVIVHKCAGYRHGDSFAAAAGPQEDDEGMKVGEHTND